MIIPERPRAANRNVFDDLRDARADARDPGAVLIPVEGGEPMPAEELPPPGPTEGTASF